MAKSIRSKIKKRLRTVKRQRVDAMLVTPREKEKNERLQRVIEGRQVTLSRPKNAFKYPEADAAVFPQHEVVKPIDFRAQSMPMAGYAYRGNRRKYDAEQAAMLEQLARTSHPKIEVIAGGGAILARDGRRVTMLEAEIMATAVLRPEAAALAASAPSTGSAVEAAVAAEASAAVAQAASGDVEMAQAEVAPAAAGEEAATAADAEEPPAPTNAADHSRPPVLKDARRAKRAAEHRPRPNSVKKKTKVKVQSPGAPTPAAPAVAPGELKLGSPRGAVLSS